MCKWIDKVVDGIDVFQVGKQQLWDWCGWTARGFDSAHSYNNEPVLCFAESLRKGVYVLVAGPATFGKYWRPRVYDSFTSLAAAVEYARHEIAWHAYDLTHYAHKVTVGYDFEIWHVVDDGELWQEWDNESAAYIAIHQPLVSQKQPVVIDQCDTWDGVDVLTSVYVPMVGQNVSFIEHWTFWGSVPQREEYVINDMQGEQPLTLEDARRWYWWTSVEVLASMGAEREDMAVVADF